MTRELIKGRRKYYFDFKGKKLHFLQIGLGNNTTFIQNMAGPWDQWSQKAHWLVQALSEQRPECVRGVGVEPVRHLIHGHWLLLRHLAYVELIHAAVSEFEAQNMEVRVLTRESEKSLSLQVGKKEEEVENTPGVL